MYLSGESLIVILFVGLLAGWLAGKIVRGTGFGMIGDILIFFRARWWPPFCIFPKLQSHRHLLDIKEIIYSAIGAVLCWGSCTCGSARGNAPSLLAHPTASAIHRRTAQLRRSRACSVRDTRYIRSRYRTGSKAKGATSLLPKPGRPMIKGDMSAEPCSAASSIAGTLSSQRWPRGSSCGRPASLSQAGHGAVGVGWIRISRDRSAGFCSPPLISAGAHTGNPLFYWTSGSNFSPWRCSRP